MGLFGRWRLVQPDAWRDDGWRAVTEAEYWADDPNGREPHRSLADTVNDPGWQPDGTGIVSNGWCGGDIQVGDSYSVRLVGTAVEGVLITIIFYAVEYDECPGEFGVQRQVEWMICGNIFDPGGTEVWSKEAYDDVTELVIDTAEEAEQRAQEWAEYALANAEIYGGWDGQPFDDSVA